MVHIIYIDHIIWPISYGTIIAHVEMHEKNSLHVSTIKFYGPKRAHVISRDDRIWKYHFLGKNQELHLGNNRSKQIVYYITKSFF